MTFLSCRNSANENVRLLCALLLSVPLLFASACGGGGSGNRGGSTPPPTPTITSVTVTGTSNSVPTGQTSQCSATVAGTGSYNSSVSWSVNGNSGGNSTVGTISTDGLYTAPKSVPTPYTVSVTATSVADTTKSASFNMIVAGTIATVTQPISSTSGGTLTLPDGSRATIPAGLLASDNTVTLTESSVPVNQPKSQLLAATGPALYLSFSSPPQFQVAKANPLVATAQSGSSSTSTAGITFQFNFGQNLPSAANAMTALASFSSQTGAVLYQGVSSAVDAASRTASAFLGQLCLDAINNALSSPTVSQLTVGIYFVDLALQPANAPTQQLLTWNPNAGQFLPFQQCPSSVSANSKVLVVVHGMLSSVEGSFTNLLGTTSFLSSEGYEAVYGIDYDWWNGLQDNGKTVGAYLDTIATCSQGAQIDILAHSEGVPVTLSALTYSSAAKMSIAHFIAIAGPILGTPVANSSTEQLGTGRYALLTAASSLPFQQMVFPPVSPGGLLDVLNDQFAADLATGTSSSGTLDSIRSTWLSDSILSQLPIVTVGGTFPDPDIAGEYIPLGPCITRCFGDFTQEPFDGIVGLDSAFGEGLDLQLYRIPALPLFHTDMVDNQGVIESLELQLKNISPPRLVTATSSSSASCQDSHWCFGPPGSTFTFTASRLTPSSSKLSIYVQDPTGAQDAPISVASLSNGTLSWTDPTPTSKAPGAYGIWLYDPDSGASNSVIETICSTNCPSPTSTVSVAVSPQTIQVPVSNLQQFNATVSGAQNTAVTWSVNGVNGGDSTVGTVNSSGLYTAPAVIPSHSTITLTATSQADANAIGTASVTIIAQSNNPVPTISGLNPPSLAAGAAPQTLTINGTGFLNSSTVTFNGIPHAATFVNASQLTISLTSADLATVGTYPVAVTNPVPGGGTSGIVNFTVTSTPPAGSGEWTWVSGSSTAGQLGVYGTQGVPAAANVPGARTEAASWTDSSGNFWFFGGATLSGAFNDLWRFNPTNDEWTWMSGSSSVNQPGVYGTQGVPASANVPGSRGLATSWTDSNGNLWLFGGSTDTNDLWQFSPATQLWTWISGSGLYGSPGVYGTQGVTAATNVPGGRNEALGWIDSNGNLWLFGGSGFDSAGVYGELNDLWEFNPTTKMWTWVSGSSSMNQPGAYGTQGVPAATNVPGGRNGAISWTDNSGKFWLFGGNGFAGGNGTGGLLNDLWEFNPTTEIWTWVSGSSSANQPGVYGTQGVPAATNIPGGREYAVSWIDGSDNLWLFGGGSPNDLWEFSLTTKMWTWVSGSSSGSQPGIYGTQGVPAATNVPGSRSSAATWVDGSDNLWLFGGQGIDSNGGAGELNDLWRYQPPSNPVVAITLLTPSQLGVGATPQTLTITGTGFLASSTVTFDGIAHAPTYVSSTQLTISLTSSDLATAGTCPVVVTNAAPGGGASAAVDFTVLPDNPVPTITGLSPASLATGAAAQTFTINGTGFLTSSTVTFDGISHSATFLNSGQLTISLTSADLGTPGTYPVVVTNPALGGGASSAAYFTVINPQTANEWAWMSGSNLVNSAPVYGKLGLASSTNVPGARGDASSWTDRTGNLWLFGGLGLDSSGDYWGELNDLWEFTPANNEWTWINGSDLANTAGVYGTQGVASSANLPSARGSSASWIDNSGNLWLFGGANGVGTLFNDLWEFNPTNKTWMWVSGADTGSQAGDYGKEGVPGTANVPGARSNAVSWVDSNGNLWLFGGSGLDSAGNSGHLNDLWEFNPTNKTWIWVSGGNTLQQFADGLRGEAGQYGTEGVPSATNVPPGREDAVSWIDTSGNLWLFGGLSNQATGAEEGYLNDLWEFNLSSGMWTWMGGADVGNQPGNYGTEYFAVPANVPGGRIVAASWTDKSGHFWLFGGFADASNGTFGYLNDLWELNLTPNCSGEIGPGQVPPPCLPQWAWWGGSTTTTGAYGTYGTQGVPGTANIPGGRAYAASWTDNGGYLWLFGGYGSDSVGNGGYLNDLWRYQP